MREAYRRQSPRHAASLDGVGHALAAGAALSGGLAVVLIALGGQGDPGRLLIGWSIASFFAALAIVAIGGPVWLACHVLGRCGPVAAALAGFGTTLLLALSAQTYGLGIFASADVDTDALAYRWVSAMATSVVLALAGGGIALLMWRIAYRRAG